MISSLKVNKIDTNLLAEIKKVHTSLLSSSDTTKELHLNLNSAAGSKEVAVEIAQILHSDASIIPVTNVTGKLDVAATIIATAGFEGRRTSDPTSSFIINDGAPYGKDSKPADLEALDYFVYDALSKMTGHKFTILKRMIEGGSFSAIVAKESKIIDKVNGFSSAFKPQKTLKGRGRKKAEAKTVPVESQRQMEYSENTIESPASKTVSRTHKSSVKTESPDGVQRGRIK